MEVLALLYFLYTQVINMFWKSVDPTAKLILKVRFVRIKGFPKPRWQSWPYSFLYQHRSSADFQNQDGSVGPTLVLYIHRSSAELFPTIISILHSNETFLVIFKHCETTFTIFPFFQWKLISLRFNYWMMSLVSFGIKSCGKLLIWWNASLERWLILRAREGHKFSCSNYLNENCQRPISAVRKMANHFMSPPRSKVAVSSHEEGRKKGIKEKATFSTLLRFFFSTLKKALFRPKCTIKVSKKGV